MGSASGGSPSGSVNGPMADVRYPSAPLARNMLTETRIATRYGMMRSATLNDSFAPEMKTS